MYALCIDCMVSAAVPLFLTIIIEGQEEEPDEELLDDG